MKTLADLRIVFLGTPDFAVASLEALLGAGANVVGVVTAPDKPAGRGMHIQQSAVKLAALRAQLPVLQPEKLKDPAFLSALAALRADLQVVVAFRMLPEVVWQMPPMGTVNVHASLLPQYRGAAPINWAIINGEPETGVTTFRLKHQIDTGNLLLQQAVAILPKDTAGTLHDKLKDAGAALLVATLQLMIRGELQEQPQDYLPEGSLKHAPKLYKADLDIDWSQTTLSIHNKVRGLSPFPAACTRLGDKALKIHETELVAGKVPALPGTIDSDGKTFLHFAAGDGWLSLLDVQLEGKKRLAVADFLRGYRF